MKFKSINKQRKQARYIPSILNQKSQIQIPNFINIPFYKSYANESGAPMRHGKTNKNIIPHHPNEQTQASTIAD